MYMIIDDVRDLNCEIIARTSQAGFQILYWIHDEVDVLVLDHDLGDMSFLDGNRLLKDIFVAGILPGKVQLCWSNPVGLNNMRKQLEDEGFVSVNGMEFERN